MVHDTNMQFHFAPIQSKFAQERIKQIGLGSIAMNTVLLMEGDQIWIKTDAIIRIAASLSGWPSYFRLLKFIPRPVRDLFYDSFAKKRYLLFGKRSTCMVPDNHLKERFL